MGALEILVLLLVIALPLVVLASVIRTIDRRRRRR